MNINRHRHITSIVLILIMGILVSCSKTGGYTIMYFPGTLEPPVFSPGEGTYSKSFFVEIASVEPGVEIRYTLDGSIPTESTGTLYDEAISVVEDVIVTAVAFKEFWTVSPPVVAEYTIVPASAAVPPHVIVNFVVDDTANMTYTDGELLWYGSLAYDPSTNFIVLEPAWMGPFPALWDDGPRALGGHEPEGVWNPAPISITPTYLTINGVIEA